MLAQTFGLRAKHRILTWNSDDVMRGIARPARFRQFGASLETTGPAFAGFRKIGKISNLPGKCWQVT